ncbi:hypothetical protein ACI78T_05530 [Blastococcus sp. SYSU D00922]
MSPVKFSLTKPGDDREDSVEFDDDDLVGELREVVDTTPDLTFEGALREGIQHVVAKRRPGGGQQ